MSAMTVRTAGRAINHIKHHHNCCVHSSLPPFVKHSMSRQCLILLVLYIATIVSFAQESVNCTLCVDGNVTLGDPSARVNTGTETLTCQDLFDRGPLELPVENCTALQAIGQSLCLCGQEAPTTNDCTLCEDGSDLEFPLLEGLTGETCAELQVDAQRDVRENCYAWQGTVGVYCGCEDNVVSSVLACRLCGTDVMLPNPLDTEMDGGDSCGALEFQASIPGANCSGYREQYSEYCCQTVPPPPVPTSDSVRSVHGVHVFGVLVVVLSTVLAG
jgi:hypothetical protein